MPHKIWHLRIMCGETIPQKFCFEIEIRNIFVQFTAPEWRLTFRAVNEISHNKKEALAEAFHWQLYIFCCTSWGCPRAGARRPGSGRSWSPTSRPRKAAAWCPVWITLKWVINILSPSTPKRQNVQMLIFTSETKNMRVLTANNKNDYDAPVSRHLPKICTI